MLVNGIERKLAWTVQAQEQVSELCENGMYENVGKLYSNISQSVKTTIKIACIMSKAYEQKRHHEDPSYKMLPEVVEEDFANDDFKIIHELDEEIKQAMAKGNGQKVQTKENAKNSVREVKE
jgi:predicted transcriptional regulator